MIDDNGICRNVRNFYTAKFADPHRSQCGSPLGIVNNRPILAVRYVERSYIVSANAEVQTPLLSQRAVRSLILLYFCELCRLGSIPEIRSPKDRIHNNLIFSGLSLSTFLMPFLRSKLSPLLRKHKR